MIFIQVPNYYKIVTKPMDFSTMKSKLSSQNGMSYGNVKEFVDDVNLIFSNCALFNPVRVVEIHCSFYMYIWYLLPLNLEIMSRKMGNIGKYNKY